VTNDIQSLELSNKIVHSTNKETPYYLPAHYLQVMQFNDEKPLPIKDLGVWNCIRLEYTSTKQVESVGILSTVRRVFSSTKSSNRVVVIGKATSTTLVALVYVPDGYICKAEKEQVKLFREIGVVCANNGEYFTPSITFDQEPGEDIEEFFTGNAAVIEDDSIGEQFGDWNILRGEVLYAFDKEPVTERYLLGLSHATESLSLTVDMWAFVKAT
jgi:hypothetical protein